MRFLRLCAMPAAAFTALVASSGCGGAYGDRFSPAGNLVQTERQESSASQLLYVADFETNSVLIYSANANGNVAAIGRIEGLHTKLVGPLDVAFDSMANIYTVSIQCKCIEVFPQGSRGDVAPIRTITRAPNAFGYWSFAAAKMHLYGAGPAIAAVREIRARRFLPTANRTEYPRGLAAAHPERLRPLPLRCAIGILLLFGLLLSP